MRLKDYARNHKRRKEYVQQPGLLLVGVDVSKSKHDACIGTQAGVICRKSASEILHGSPNLFYPSMVVTLEKLEGYADEGRGKEGDKPEGRGFS